MDDKHWYLSKTILGAVIMLVAIVLKMMGIIDLSPEEQDQAVTLIIDAATAISVLVGFVLVLYGRIKAKTHLIG